MYCHIAFCVLQCSLRDDFVLLLPRLCSIPAMGDVGVEDEAEPPHQNSLESAANTTAVVVILQALTTHKLQTLLGCV